MISNVIYKHKRNACSNTKTKSEWHEIATVVEILQCANKSATSGNHSLFDYYHHSSPAGQRPPHQQLTIEEAAAGLPHLSLSLSLSFSLSSFFLIFCHFIPTFFPLTISTSIKTKRNYSKRKTKKEGKKKHFDANSFLCGEIQLRWWNRVKVKCYPGTIFLLLSNLFIRMSSNVSQYQR